jgi:hypothetical protein
VTRLNVHTPHRQAPTGSTDTGEVGTKPLDSRRGFRTHAAAALLPTAIFKKMRGRRSPASTLLRCLSSLPPLRPPYQFPSSRGAPPDPAFDPFRIPPSQCPLGGAGWSVSTLRDGHGGWWVHCLGARRRWRIRVLVYLHSASTSCCWTATTTLANQFRYGIDSKSSPPG